MQRLSRSVVAAGKPRARQDLPCLVLLTVLLASAFLMGGSARSDVASLLLLQPMTAAIFAGSLILAGRSAWRRAPFAVAIAGTALALCLSHLAPLPPSIWSALPGRAIAVDVYRVAGMALPWHPLTLTPQHTWGAAFFLLAPLAALILSLALPALHLRQALAVLIGFALLNAAIGVLQALGVPGLHFYEITNREFPTGLFANRNHAALVFACTLPLLGLCTSDGIGRKPPLRLGEIGAAMIAVAIIPLILLTGSRVGLVAAALAVPLALWVRSGGKPAHRFATATTGIALTTILALALVFVLGERAPAILRLAETGGPSELRFAAAPAIWRAVVDHWPAGSGIGSFVEIYGIYEPRDLLAVAYLNHAHNDLLELLLTGGLPAAALLLAGLAGLVWGATGAFRHSPSSSNAVDDPRWARAGLSIIALLLLGSVFDYPLRTTIGAVLLAISAALVMRQPRQSGLAQGAPR